MPLRYFLLFLNGLLTDDFAFPDPFRFVEETIGCNCDLSEFKFCCGTRFDDESGERNSTTILGILSEGDGDLLVDVDIEVLLSVPRFS